MRFNFKIQPFQTEAVDAVVRVFDGQPKQAPVSYRREMGMKQEPVGISFPLSFPISFPVEEGVDNTGYHNARIELSGFQLLKNIKKIQTENKLKLSPSLVKELGAVSLDVEMETGTGKTYVYIKTMFELHKQYGWGKYIVVVPSIPIREGVKKTFEDTQEHFMEHYGIKARFFVYNSSNLHQLDEFSSGHGINVMIINTQAFASSLKEGGRSKEARIIYDRRDEFGSRRPIDVIKANRPIIILDEPQKMGGAATQNALKNNFNPLFSLNYSATHKVSHNLVYVLDPLDAFQKKLVKKIEVKGFEVRNLHGTDGYLYFAEIVLDRKKPPRARLEFDVKYKNGVQREIHILNAGDNLYEKSKKLEAYKGLSIAEVDPFRGVITLSNGEMLSAGNACGNVNEQEIRRIQIRETINSHFDKEESLFAQGIKCLSLFFIDEVAKYRSEDDEKRLGEYGEMFEDEYVKVLEGRLPQFSAEYREYLKRIEVRATHGGYFSIDKQGRAVNSAVKRGNDCSDDISAYELILKNKGRLLSFEEPTRFIFSHSALGVGWDNPNVFQICTLKHSESATTKRQEVGRGLRLCVNKFGDRQDTEVCSERDVHDINKLTVIASESYNKFVRDLQSEISDDLYERPTKAEKEYFTDKVLNVDGKQRTITEREAIAIYNYLVKNDYVDDDGAITSIYHDAVAAGTLAPLKDDLVPLAEGIHALVQAIFDPTILNRMIENGHDTKVKTNPINENWRDFQELWERINKCYAYTVEFDSPELIQKSITALNANLFVSSPQYVMTEGTQTGIAFEVSQTKTRTFEHSQNIAVKYDLIGKITEGATLTRRTTAAILCGLKQEKISTFRINPEAFVQQVIEEINRQKAAVVVEHVSYQPSAEESYSQEIFNMSRSSQEYAKALLAKKAIQDYVFCDSDIEETFANDMDAADEVVVYAKLPRGPKGFYIPTPVGNYSPDWAITFKRGSVKHIFFIAETKGTMDSLKLSSIEHTKIECAKKLFNEISTIGVKYHNVDSYQKLLDIMETL